ncbi:hypothetical protein GCM10023172_07250 [Hymenobacter ginsengisoli]|uniref:MotA/TolQ/ExbB proton channel domain-containing protein n=1 Tax=Hymenobacter ginsengisoli TaxID=1051626 RepID=A0ABP8Q1K6_9BACT|nr:MULTISPECIES: hypothetical protein [unclassified Hymenobacter]MBO2032626.1 hypothetical protein [Hymenobacter sp. BT559]
MGKKLLLLLLLAFTLRPAAAQTSVTAQPGSERAQPLPASPPTPSARVATPAPLPNLTRADTARAIRKLFKSRRGGGAGWLGFGTASILASTLPALQTTSAGVWTPGVVAGSAFLLIGLNKRIQFRPGRERQVLRELAATGHLRTSVSRRLRGNFAPLRGLPSDYDPLSAPDIRPAASTVGLTAAQLAEVAHADTLRAINRLFERRRTGGKRWNYLGLAGILSMTRALASPNIDGDKVDGGSLAILLGGFVAAPVAIGVTNLVTYNEARESEIENAYRSGKPLPKKIRQRIKKKDLQPLD